MRKRNRTPENAVRVAVHSEIVTLSVSVLKKMSRRKLRCKDVHHTGNTDYSSDEVFAEFLECGLMEGRAGRRLGYFCGPTGNCSGIARRMKYIQEETRNLYEAYRDFNKAGHVVVPLSWILDPKRSTRGLGRNRRNISVRICHEMIAYHMGSRIRASIKTGVPRSTISYWLNLGYKA
mgnify:FL=1